MFFMARSYFLLGTLFSVIIVIMIKFTNGAQEAQDVDGVCTFPSVRLPVTNVSIPDNLLNSVSIQTKMMTLSEDRSIGCVGLVDEGGSSAQSSSLNGTNLLAHSWHSHKHGFIAAATIAFADHYPLSLRPQHFWLMILQAVSIHVDLNAEKIRGKWVPHEGKKTLTVNRDDFVIGRANDWAEVVPEFSEQIDANLVAGLAGVLSAPFSGTTSIEDVAMKITVMDVCKNFFQYKIMTSCGIPYIVLEGSEEDWVALRSHAEELIREHCLESFSSFWLPSLLPLLDKFVEQYRVAATSTNGPIDSTFWNSICKRGGVSRGSGGITWLNGWFNVFFPIIQNKHNYHCTPYSPNQDYVTKVSDDAPGPDIQDFPNGLAKAPVEWNFMGKKIDLNFVAGFVGASQDPETKVISPHVGWFIAKKISEGQ